LVGLAMKKAEAASSCGGAAGFATLGNPLTIPIRAL
jgi:hypothetical protein